MRERQPKNYFLLTFKRHLQGGTVCVVVDHHWVTLSSQWRKVTISCLKKKVLNVKPWSNRRSMWRYISTKLFNRSDSGDVRFLNDF